MRAFAHQAADLPSTPETARGMGNWGAIRTLLPYLWPKGAPGLRARVVLSLLFMAAAKVANVTVPIFYKGAVDALAGEPPGDGTVAAATVVAVPVFLIVAYGVARLLSVAFQELRNAVFERVEQRAIRKAALNVFRHLHGLSLRFHLERRTGGLSRTIDRGIIAIENLLSTALFNIVPTLIEIALVTAVLWHLFDWRFALVVFVTVTGYVAYTVVVTNWRMAIRRRMIEADTTAKAKSVDSLLNFETVKYFGNERFEADRYERSLTAYEHAAVQTQSSLSLLNVGQGFVVGVGMVVTMWMAADGIAAGTLTIGDFVLVNTYLLQLFAPLNIFGAVYRAIKESLNDMEKMFDLLAVPQEVTDRPGAGTLATGGAEVRFEDVAFGYDPRRPILHGVSFTIPAGRTVAVVGPSGAGKSTLSRLLYRFYEVTGGRILIDGQDIRDVTQESLRAAIGIVPQDTVLFNDTIAYNIGYGRPGAPRTDLERVAAQAQIKGFVEALPDGWETTVGERGLKLSGGEKQRVAIARTLLKDPPILILDEATSALDTHTERDIQAALKEAAKGRTTLVIAHRLSTIVDADEILVLEAGRIVERGRFAELLTAGGSFAALWERQQGERQQAAEQDGNAVPDPT